MKISAAACLLLVSSAQAFVPVAQQRTSVARFMAEEVEEAAPAPAPAAAPTGGALVPIKQETVEFTAGILGGVAGFAVGGPVLGAIGAAAANYASKSGGDVSEVVQAVSKSSIQVFNYLAGLDAKYEVLSKAKKSLEKSLDNLKKQDSVDPETVAKVESALKNTKSKITEINDEYDLVGGATTALGVIGELVEKAIQKAGELNEEYKLTDKAKTSLKTAVDKAKDAAKDASS